MRIAIFSDVHGNLSGLEAVLDDIEQQKPDQIVFAGDLCFLGARPAACLRLLRERRIPSVAGNTDIWLTAGGEPERLRPVFEWGVAQLTPDDLGWPGGLPVPPRGPPAGFGGRGGLRCAGRAPPGPRAADDLLIVHANPRNVNDIVFPSEADQITRWGTVRQPDAELEPLLGWVEAAVVAYGHLHIPGVRHWGALTLVNVSSVTMPGDEDGRAKYALLEWANGRWKMTHHRVAYDTAGEAEAFRQNRPPGWEAAVASLEEAGYYYPQRI